MESEVAAEQQFVDLAYDRLEAMRAEARSMMEGVLDLGRGGTFQSRTERDVIVRTSLARLEQLDIGDQVLTFGRIDRLRDAGSEDKDGAAGGEDGEDGVETFHIGRLAVHGPDQEPLVVDWRAPVAAPFYRATGRDPLGLVLRRHLALDGRRVVGVEDERFEPADARVASGHEHEGMGAPDGQGALERPAPGGDALVATDLPIGGPASLLAALGRARTGSMRDIVATIQAEQDEIIRSPLGGVLVVQGGPGTGKTAVALHRAAYLLYTHRFPLERQGVLVVGPNPVFLRYIEQVLPSLGETGVTLSTVSGLVPEIRVRAEGPPEVARLKGDARMATVMARAVATRERPLREDALVPFGALVLRLTVADSRRIVEAARRRPGTHNARRRLVEHQVAEVLAARARQAQQRLRIGPEPTGLPGFEETAELEDDDEFDLEEFSRKVRRVPEVADALDRMWPRLSPHELLHDLLGARPLLAAASSGVLTGEEQELLFRPRSPSFDEVEWTAADAALVDEARHLLGPRQPGGEELTRYGHIVVDEAQDLSPMQLRMLTRRSLSGSMTVVGDVAQATAPWAPADWTEILAHLPNRRTPRTVELTVSYRTPAEVLEMAGRILALLSPDLEPPRPVRRSGHQPRLVAVTAEREGDEPTDGDTARVVAAVAAEELVAAGGGQVAVLAPGSLLPVLAEALRRAGLLGDGPGDANGDRVSLSEPLVLVATEQSNGLEFDAVVVVEPGLIAGETARGLRTLYVALTRPTRRLAVVHRAPPPAALLADGP